MREQSLGLIQNHFMAVVAHELRAPLGALIGFAELLQSQDLEPYERQKISESILRNAEMLLRLVEDILDFSRMENGKLGLNHEKIELRNFLTQVHADLAGVAAAKGLSLVIAPPEKESYFLGDAVRIRQILFNLLGNALKFTEQGSVHLSFAMQPFPGTTDSKMTLIFRVQDTGIGISPEGIAELFKPFGQAENFLTRSHKGTGLGLVISQQLARLMGGDLKLISTEPDRGSIFEVSLMVEELSVSVTPA